MHISPKFALGLGSLVLLTCALTFGYAQGPIKRPTQSGKPSEPRVITTPSDSVARKLVSVPNVVGTLVSDAFKALEAAGLRPKITYLDQPNPLARRGLISAIVPDAGSLVIRGTEVELRIPRATNAIGKGKLGITDVERRMGFDVDTARYEEMCSGADFVLLKVTARDGSIGLAISATGGARLWNYDQVSDVRDVERPGLGSYLNYTTCEDAVRNKRNKGGSTFQIGYGITHLPVAFCVLTSKKQIGVVEFKEADYIASKDDNYVFDWALFENEPPLRPTELRP